MTESLWSTLNKYDLSTISIQLVVPWPCDTDTVNIECQFRKSKWIAIDFHTTKYVSGHGGASLDKH